ncbi:MAG: acetyl-CoA carboxylase biotin carboxyl carrier protein subunit [Candidatus Epulonipiscium fishelsonii]|nr:MAG: acetyl-CoA carboxylase biotin carboxyl carrier protein subunit [Epulopiscium sp. AS2M-Bin002]
MRKFQVVVNGNSYEVDVEEIGAGQSIAPVVTSAPKKATPAAPAPKAPAAPVTGTKVVAPMPGKIVDIKVTQGQAVKEGDLVAVLEAMKMENEIFASATGKVASIVAQKGATIEANDVIITIA